MARKSKAERFKIRKVVNPGGTAAWQVGGTTRDGERVRRNFSSQTEAIEFKAILENEYHSGQPEYTLKRTNLSDDALAQAYAAFAVIGTRSLSELVSKILDYEKRAEAKKVTLEQAFSFFEHNFKGEFRTATIYDARTEFLASKENLSSKTREHCRVSTRFLLKDPNRYVHDFTVQDIEKILAKYPNPETHRTSRRGISAFFTWAVRFRYCLENPCLRLNRPPPRNKTNVILSLDEVKRLLKASMLISEGQPCASLAIALFAGLRPSEIEELKPVDIREGQIRVEGGKMKGRSRRMTPIPTVLKAWLKKYPFTGRPKNWEKQYRKLRDWSHPRQWVQDILRHTSISFQADRDKNEALTAVNSGNSTTVIQQHYREIIDNPDDVKAFWSLTPEVIEKVDLKIPEKKNPAIQWPAKAKLAKLVYEKPLSRLAEDLGCSDNAIRKHCIKLGIDLPQNGYWQKKRARKF